MCAGLFCVMVVACGRRDELEKARPSISHCRSYRPFKDQSRPSRAREIGPFGRLVGGALAPGLLGCVASSKLLRRVRRSFTARNLHPGKLATTPWPEPCRVYPTS